MMRRRFLFVLGVRLSLAAGLLGSDALAQSDNQLTAMSDAYEELVAKVDPAVVQIFASGYTAVQPSPGHDAVIGRQQATGSGVLLDPRGYIITNNHVISGARRVQVLLSPVKTGSSVLRPYGELLGARIIGVDEETDLAVLKVRGENLPFLELGDSELLRPGELVFAFGSPLGLESSVTQGIVSAKARQLRREDPMIYVQTDAPINPGNSGGPLVDTRGRVVGINTLILSQSGGSEGLGFAAPSNIVKTIFEQIRDNGRVRRGVIGVYAQTLTPALSQGLGIPIESKVILGDVMPNGPGAQAGLNPGDVILTLDGKSMENARQFDVNVYGKQIGKKVTLEVRRGSRNLSIDCEVVERPGDLFRFKELANPEDSHVKELDILALEVDQRIRSMLPNLRYDAGVLVAVSSGRASVWGDGLLPGDVIYNVNDKRVTTVDELRKAVEKMKPAEIFVVHLERRGQLMYSALEVE